MGFAGRPAPVRRNGKLALAIEDHTLRAPGHVPTPPRPQTGFAAAGLPQGRPHLFGAPDQLLHSPVGAQSGTTVVEGFEDSRRVSTSARRRAVPIAIASPETKRAPKRSGPARQSLEGIE